MINIKKKSLYGILTIVAIVAIVVISSLLKVLEIKSEKDAKFSSSKDMDWKRRLFGVSNDQGWSGKTFGKTFLVETGDISCETWLLSEEYRFNSPDGIGLECVFKVNSFDVLNCCGDCLFCSNDECKCMCEIDCTDDEYAERGIKSSLRLWKSRENIKIY